MICTVLQHKNAEQIWEALDNCEMAEIRLDLCELTLPEIEELFSSDVPLVATCRISQNMSPQMAERRLIKAVEAGARFVDVELEAPKEMSKRIRSCARENGTVFIRSFHDFNGTDSLPALKAIIDKCRYHGADMVKLVTTAHSEEDVERVLSLYDEYEPYGLIAFCMGDAGRRSRMECLAHGAPYTYAAYAADDLAAPGQWTADEMCESLYGSFDFIDARDLRMPASKSYAQRAILCAALAEGESVLRHYSPCGDSEAALGLARQIGAEVTVDEDGTVRIKGVAAGTSSSRLAFPDELFVGESGLLTRLVIPLVTQLAGKPVIINGEKTLAKRSLDGVPQIMEAFGARVESLSGGDCVTVPLRVSGPLANGRIQVSGRYGSQLISGLLTALPFASKNTTVAVSEPKSIPYMYISLEVLRKFGVKVANDMLGGPDFLESGDWNLCSGIDFKVKGGLHYRAAELDLEGDWSAAANFLVAGAVFGRVEIEGLDTNSLQADLSIMDILMDAGASLSQTDDSKGTIVAQRAPLSAFSADASNCPDLFPIVAVLAAFCQGESHIAGVGRLAHKESDRGKAILEMLTLLGVEAGIIGDELVVQGESLARRLLNGRMLQGGSFSSHHDHRMLMALKVASLAADSPLVIDDEDCVSKSFPEFNQMFEQL